MSNCLTIAPKRGHLRPFLNGRGLGFTQMLISPSDGCRHSSPVGGLWVPYLRQNDVLGLYPGATGQGSPKSANFFDGRSNRPQPGPRDCPYYRRERSTEAISRLGAELLLFE